ncbi:hypothetical protein MRB53_000208 [Persea americana]|uniref:Uncharacterized protein n=1 Tax=Persea americana TaxID=3435 RepID=A0ACC2MN91_PERAE|nr:hypothetical protein MRB53_000208 [Persea americana]
MAHKMVLHVSPDPKGTYSYAAPEYVATGHLHSKSDVYSFGVLWLEMLSGLRVLNPNRPTEHYNLLKGAKPYLSNRRKLLSLVMDEQIEGQYPSKGAVLAAKLTVKCLETEARGRPSMSEVVRTLEKIQAIKHKP